MSGDRLLFHDNYDCCNRRSISLDAKILISLKFLAYGVTPNCWTDYFQISETYAHKCVEHFVDCLVGSTFFVGKYLRDMTPVDMKRVTDLHQEKHDVPGMPGSIDCTHFFLKNCPMGWQNHYIGKEKKPTIMMEAVADYSLWLWYTLIGWAGSLKDINIWDASPPHKLLLQNCFELLDFEFEIAGNKFSLLYFLANGIYPGINCFVQLYSEPAEAQRNFAKWQEASRKDVERAFGVLKGKFFCLTLPVEKWQHEFICKMAKACVILHNCCVKKRISNDEIDSLDHYDFDDLPEGERLTTFTEKEVVAEEQLVGELKTNFEEQRALGNVSSNIELQRRIKVIEILPHCCRIAQRRWEKLYDEEENNRLRQALIEDKRKSRSSNNE